mmetsp:Transcript_22828/g.60137  ORF Transcript_22828/g.60137 Transcript_22828/m.60137 type:complete len:247 (-) Transcript_22828:290-1030(-)
MIDDVRRLRAVHFILVILRLASRREDGHGLATDDAAHEIKEVAPFLNKGTSRVFVEAVPVLHLDEEREAVLTDRHGEEISMSATVHLLDEPGDRWHPSVLHSHHEDPWRWSADELRPGISLHQQPLDLHTIVDCGAEWLLAENVFPRRDGHAQNFNVMVVGCTHDERIHQVTRNNILESVENRAGSDQLALQLLTDLCVHFSNSYHDGNILAEQCNVTDVLLTHHASANDTDPQRRVSTDSQRCRT